MTQLDAAIATAVEPVPVPAAEYNLQCVKTEYVETKNPDKTGAKRNMVKLTHVILDDVPSVPNPMPITTTLLLPNDWEKSEGYAQGWLLDLKRAFLAHGLTLDNLDSDLFANQQCKVQVKVDTYGDDDRLINRIVWPAVQT